MKGKEKPGLIAIVDYGMGNLRSVWKALRHLGAQARLTQSPSDIREARGIVLPGVGAFRDCMANLERLGLLDPIMEAIRAGKPYLGICLGLQVLFEESEEFGTTRGMGVLQGRVVRFPPDMPAQGKGPRPFLTVPHMGWNSIRIVKQAPHLEGIPQKAYFYFVHSYFGVPRDFSVAATTTNYGMDFVSSIWKENVFACQFHPEKSQAAGLKILKNFLGLCS